MAFHLDDRTNGSLFADYETDLIVERPDGLVTTTMFNHNDSAYVGVQAGERYNLTVVSDAPAVVETWFIPVNGIDNAPLILGSERFGTAVRGDDLRVNYTTSPDANRSTVRYVAPEETTIRNIEYTIEDDDSDPVTNYTQEFEEPVEYYERDINRTQVNQSTSEGTDLEDIVIDYSGTYANGTEFDGLANLTFDAGFGAAFGGPTGATGSGGNDTVQTIAGLVLLGGGAFIAARRFDVAQSVAAAARRLGP